MGSAQFNDPEMASRPFPAFMRENLDREKFDVAVSVIERVVDVAAVMSSGLLASYIYRVLDVGKHLQYPTSLILTVGFVFAVTFVIMLGHEGAYQQVSSLLRIRETECILRVSAKAFGILFALSFFFSHPFSRWIVVLTAVILPLILIAEKQLIFSLIRSIHSHGYAVQNVLIYGAGFTGRQIFSALARSPKIGLHPIAVIDDDRRLSGKQIYESGYRRERSAPVIAGPLTSEMIRELGASLIVVGIPSIAAQRLDEIAGAAFNAGAKAAFVPQLTCGPETYANYVDIDGVLIAALGQRNSKFGYEAAKRAMDFCTSLILIFLMLPVWALISILIRMDSKGPAFFCQTRVGRGGKRFNLYKFRSMKVDAPKFGFHPTDAHDPRITRIGRWLRRTSLDELPQLINILKGEMSLVGPRPEMPFIVERYNERHAERLSVTPGLTGLWQISADRAFLIHENIQYDLYYIRNRNFFMDIAILLHTIVFAMKGL